jgi:hypothetical protein
VYNIYFISKIVVNPQTTIQSWSRQPPLHNGACPNWKLN